MLMSKHHNTLKNGKFSNKKKKKQSGKNSTRKGNPIMETQRIKLTINGAKSLLALYKQDIKDIKQELDYNSIQEKQTKRFSKGQTMIIVNGEIHINQDLLYFNKVEYKRLEKLVMELAKSTRIFQSIQYTFKYKTNLTFELQNGVDRWLENSFKENPNFQVAIVDFSDEAIEQMEEVQIQRRKARKTKNKPNYLHYVYEFSCGRYFEREIEARYIPRDIPKKIIQQFIKIQLKRNERELLDEFKKYGF